MSSELNFNEIVKPKIFCQLSAKTSDSNKYLITSEKEIVGKLAMKNKIERLEFKGTQLLDVQEDATLYLQEKEIDFHVGSERIETTFSLLAKLPNISFDSEFTQFNYTKIEKVKLMKEYDTQDQEIQLLKKNVVRKNGKQNREKCLDHYWNWNFNNDNIDRGWYGCTFVHEERASTRHSLNKKKNGIIFSVLSLTRTSELK